MSDFSLPIGLALSSWGGFALGCIPRPADSGGKSEALIDHLYPVTVAFFLGYLALTLVPHALFESMGPFAGFAAGLGAMAFLTRKVFHRDPCCESGHAPDPLGMTAFLALSVCAVNDGMLIGLKSPPFLSGLNLGMVAHKVASSFSLALTLGHWHFRGRRLWILGLANGLISPLCFFGGSALQDAPRGTLDILLGFSGGVLSYTVFKGMLPHSGQMLKRRPMAWVGFLAALAISLYLGWVHQTLH